MICECPPGAAFRAICWPCSPAVDYREQVTERYGNTTARIRRCRRKSKPRRKGSCHAPDQDAHPRRVTDTLLGSEVRRAAAGMTQADLGALVPCDNSTVSRVEASILAPDEAFALACDTAFPHVGGWFTRFYRECNGWSAPFPS
jgi:ribosome-binding protein aMBF1 (putative translation factor)